MDPPQAAGTIGLTAQGFALLGTLVGIFTIVIGVGPRSGPDIVYRVILVALLVSQPSHERSGAG